MSILEAAEKILADVNEPLKTREITRRIVDAGLWVPHTKTPADSVASLREEMERK